MSFHADESIADLRMRVREAVSRQLDTVLRIPNHSKSHDKNALEVLNKCDEKTASRIAKFRRKVASKVTQGSDTDIHDDTMSRPSKSPDSSEQTQIAQVKALIEAESHRLESLKVQIAHHRKKLSTSRQVSKPMESGDRIELESLTETVSEVSRVGEVRRICGTTLESASSDFTYTSSSASPAPTSSGQSRQNSCASGYSERRSIQLKKQTDYLQMVSRNISRKLC